jgi:hypothetical protein
MYSPNETTHITSLEQMRDYVREELRAISRAFAETTVLELRTINAEPKRPREGMIVSADGTDWEPDGASGAGIYAYVGGTWIPLHT